MLLSQLIVDKGLMILLDSELADVGKANLLKATTKLSKKSASRKELEEEQKEYKFREVWN